MYVLNTIATRLKRGCETMPYPNGPAPALPDRHTGALRADPSRCDESCSVCVPVCPTNAIEKANGNAITLDLGKCIFCADCIRACPTGAIVASRDHRMAVRNREDLVVGKPGQEEVRLAAALDETLRKLFGRSLRLRQVSAGGCNACEADTNVLGTIGWDLGRFGIQFVASPRHADGLLITGNVPKNMVLALQKTYAATPAPKIVIAVGACAIAGGPFIGHPQIHNGASAIVPVDLYIPGCPPHPMTILDGVLRLLNRMQKARA